VSNGIIDITAEITPLDTGEALGRAKELVHGVMVRKQEWVDAWREQAMRPDLLTLEEFPPDSVGCAPGSCQLKSGGRVLGKFIVRFDEGTGEVTVDAEWPEVGKI
jgi:hypothetical protein